MISNIRTECESNIIARNLVYVTAENLIDTVYIAEGNDSHVNTDLPTQWLYLIIRTQDSKVINNWCNPIQTMVHEWFIAKFLKEPTITSTVKKSSVVWGLDPDLSIIVAELTNNLFL